MTRRLPLPATLGAGLFLALGGAVARGGDAALGSALAAVLVVAFFSSGALPLGMSENAGLTRGAGAGLLLMTYVLRLAVVLAVLLAANAADVLDTSWTGVTLISCTLIWSLAALTEVIRGVRDH